jgi:hypothetical protein
VFFSPGIDTLNKTPEHLEATGHPSPSKNQIFKFVDLFQGFSGMNRARDGASALFNNSKIAVCLSYLDYYRQETEQDRLKTSVRDCECLSMEVWLKFSIHFYRK